MTKQEFLIQLQKALNGKISSSSIQSHVRYYDDYISMEMRKGKTEETVLEELGDPHLLAKTIVAADAGAQQNGPDRKEPGKSYSIRRIPGWLVIVLVLLLIGFLLYPIGIVVFKFIYPPALVFVNLIIYLHMIGIGVRRILPFAIPLAVVWLIIRYLRRR